MSSQTSPSLSLEFKHDNNLSCQEFLSGSATVLGGRDFSRPLQVLQQQWVETVGDLRLLVQEAQLRQIGLPIRLCVWIEEELCQLSDADHIDKKLKLHGSENREDEKSSASRSGFRAVFVYVGTDFDNRGVIFNIATRGDTKAWSNPAEAGLVRITTSGILRDSVPESAVVGRDVVRCVTAAEEGAWFAIDLLTAYCQPTHYSLRHYSSWDTECLRDWRFEASADGETWVLLREHRGDTALNAKGATYTWPIMLPDSEPVDKDIPANFFRIFRVKMTGPNSNNHLYLSLSGFELYGSVYSTTEAWLNEYRAPAPPSMASAPPTIARVTSSFKPVGGGGAQADGWYRYVADFDGNGIIENLGTHGSTRPWTNPAENGTVVISASTIMQDSVPISAMVGHDVVRCVTRPQPNSWFSIDLVDKMVLPTHYSIRHYSSWDTEAVRTWRFEGSNDNQNWTLLREHIRDESLNGKGSTHTWNLNVPPIAYRYFRILQTAENSNNHHYLAVSGFELYGRLLKSDGVTPYIFTALPSLPAGLSDKEFIHSGSDFDENGIIYYIATHAKTRPWNNPAEQSLVKITASSLVNDSAPVSAVVGNKVVRCVTRPEANSWFVIDLINYEVRPTAYTIRHYSSWDTEAVRNWLFQASNDGNTWTTLREHKDDQALNAKGATHTWQIPKTSSRYRLFRILQTGPNSNNHHYLAVSGFELYGSLSSVSSSSSSSAMSSSSSASANNMNVSPSASAAPLISSSQPSSNVSSPVPAVGSLGGQPNDAALSAFEFKGSDVAGDTMKWDSVNKGQYLKVQDSFQSVVTNTGSADKWQMVRSAQSFASGVHKCAIKITTDTKTSNTWRFIVGVIPSSLDCAGPKQWVGTSNSWGYIAGTGGKCHGQARSIPYGDKFGLGDVVGILLDFDKNNIEFYKNGVSQGVAFNNLVGPVHIAVSLTATDSVVACCPWMDAGDAAPAADLGWDARNKSTFLAIDEKSAIVTNTGSSDKWQSVRSIKLFTPPDKSNPDDRSANIQSFEVEVTQSPKTPNSWMMIVGVVPPTFTCSGSKQWVGAGESWGYIAGTGGKCFNVPRSTPYGETYGSVGDIIRCTMDFEQSTVEFFKNGVSQGIAFRNLKGPVHAAVSLTATGSQAKLRLL